MSVCVAGARRTGATCTHFPVARYRGRRIADENARVGAFRLARLAAADARVAVGARGGCLFGGGRRAGRSVPFTRWHADLAADAVDVYACSPGHTRAASGGAAGRVAGWMGAEIRE